MGHFLIRLSPLILLPLSLLLLLFLLYSLACLSRRGRVHDRAARRHGARGLTRAPRGTRGPVRAGRPPAAVEPEPKAPGIRRLMDPPPPSDPKLPRTLRNSQASLRVPKNSLAPHIRKTAPWSGIARAAPRRCATPWSPTTGPPELEGIRWPPPAPPRADRHRNSDGGGSMESSEAEKHAEAEKTTQDSEERHRQNEEVNESSDKQRQSIKSADRRGATRRHKEKRGLKTRAKENNATATGRATAAASATVTQAPMLPGQGHPTLHPPHPRLRLVLVLVPSACVSTGDTTNYSTSVSDGACASASI